MNTIPRREYFTQRDPPQGRPKEIEAKMVPKCRVAGKAPAIYEKKKIPHWDSSPDSDEQDDSVKDPDYREDSDTETRTLEPRRWIYRKQTEGRRGRRLPVCGKIPQGIGLHRNSVVAQAEKDKELVRAGLSRLPNRQTRPSENTTSYDNKRYTIKSIHQNFNRLCGPQGSD